MDIETITNYIKVSELIASPGQPGDDQSKEISSAGYQVVINLTMPNAENAITEEGNIVTALKMIYVQIPVSFNAPDINHLRYFLKILKVLSEHKIWIHCVLNYCVSAFLYQYWRIVLAASHDEACKVMLSSWQADEIWQRFMRIEAGDI